MSSENLALILPLRKALKDEGYTELTPIQKKAIPVVLSRKDLLGCAQTGTGKTAAFALPILQIIENNKTEVQPEIKNVKALILTPTRELAIQIGDSFEAYGRYVDTNYAVVFGGVTKHYQKDALTRGVDVLIATPGRLLDLMGELYIDFKNLELFVLDEADRMLDMGFIDDIKKILGALPEKRQSLFFSATMPPEIVKLADKILKDPVKVEVSPNSSSSEMIQQAVYFVDKNDKKNLLIHLLKDKSIETALVFSRTKYGADNITDYLKRAGIRAEAIHGDKSQDARQQALSNFKNKKIRVLVATDIAARGIDIDDLSHVINVEIPDTPETYVHRIGRTGRAGANGISISFCDNSERGYLDNINKLISKTIPAIYDHPYSLYKGD